MKQLCGAHALVLKWEKKVLKWEKKKKKIFRYMCVYIYINACVLSDITWLPRQLELLLIINSSTGNINISVIIIVISRIDIKQNRLLWIGETYNSILYMGNNKVVGWRMLTLINLHIVCVSDP